MNNTEFICKCGKHKAWVTDGAITRPCPEYKRLYYGSYNNKQFQIEVIEIKELRGKIKD